MDKFDSFTYFRNKIEEKHKSYFPDLDSKNLTIRGYSLGGRFASTWRFDLVASNVVKTLYAKTCPIYERLDPARLEFETLAKLHESIEHRDPTLGVARPVDYFPEIHGYIQESVGEHDLRSYILRNNTFFKTERTRAELVKLISGAARWLAMFHQLTHTKDSRIFYVEEFFENFVNEYKFSDLQRYRLPSRVLRDAHILLESLGGLDSQVTVSCASWHWDYTPGHVYLDDNRINVIDILGLEDTPVYEDVGHFLASLNAMNNLPKYISFDRKFVTNNLCNTFVDTYRQNAGKTDISFDFMVNLYWLKYLLIYFLDQAATIERRLHKSLARLVIDYIVKPRMVPCMISRLNYLNSYLEKGALYK